MSESRTPCAACKLQRRRCTQDCVFAPHFPPENPEKFQVVHQVFGASNVGKILSDLDVSQRAQGVVSLVFEAEARIHDLMYGCVRAIYYQQQTLKQIALEIEKAKKELALYEALDSHLQQQTNYNSCIGHGHGGPLIICEPPQKQQRQEQVLYGNYDQQQGSYDNHGSHVIQVVEQGQGRGDHHNVQEQYQNLRNEDHQQQKYHHQPQEMPEDPNGGSIASC